LEHFPDATSILLSDPGSLRQEPIRNLFGQPVFNYSLQDAIHADYLKPPEGYTSVRLETIADITAGIGGVRDKLAPEGDTQSSWKVATGKALGEGNSIDVDALEPIILDRSPARALDYTNYILQPNDILMTSYLVGGSRPRVALVPDNIPDRTLFTNRLIRIRLISSDVDPDDVIAFLISGVGVRIMRGFSTQTRIGIRDIAQIPVFLPSKEPKEGAFEGLSALAQAIQQIRKDILPALEQIESRSDASENSGLRLVALKLRSLASELVEPPLAEKVITQYPIPIALAYRRFQDARFNVYEQVLRLRDLAEATCFFIYNITLADVLQRLDARDFFVADPGARRAYNGFSMSARLDFVASVLETAKRSNLGGELFVPEMMTTNTVVLGKRIQEDLRNRISHTATATESQQRRLLDEFQPTVEEMIEELDFLADYRLARIPSLLFRRGQLLRRVELYRGTVASVEEQPVKESEIEHAESDHMVLLNAEDAVLDLHPIYQLVASKETRYETHLCFLKQRKAKDRRLEGESVSGAFEIDLDGFDEFETLQAGIRDHPVDSGG
jgi:hypothetical protein